MRRSFWLCFLLYGIAIMLCLSARLYLGFETPVTGDEIEIMEPAMSVADGRGYLSVPQQSPDGIPQPTAYRMPLPALVLASCFLVAGEGLRTAHWAMILISSFSAPLMYLFCVQGMSRRAATATAVACAAYPTWVYYSVHVLSESLFIPALFLALGATVRVAGRGITYQFGTGLLWGVVTLIRPHGLPIAGLYCLLFASRRRWRAAALIAAGVAVALAPWVIRNYLVIGAPVLLATEGGETMLGANNPYVLNDPKLYGMWVAPLSIPEYKARLAPVRGEVERNRAQNEIAYEFLSQHTNQIPVLVYRKTLRWLTPLTHTGGVIRVIVLCSYGLLLAVLVVGLVRRRVVRSPQLTAALVGTLCFSVVTAIYWGNLTRGRIPLELLWLPVAVHTLFVGTGGAVDTQRKEATT